MPRPGPRPYECVRRAWHSDRHQPMRGCIIQQIFRLVTDTHSPATKKNKEWQEKLPTVVLKAEEIMYSKANSEAEYMNHDTLWDRVNDAINTIIRRDESTETGDLLPPCVEAALNLGCIPVRASRSQRHINPRTYLSPRAQEPARLAPSVLDRSAEEGCHRYPSVHSANQLNIARGATNTIPFVQSSCPVAENSDSTAPHNNPFLYESSPTRQKQLMRMDVNTPVNLGTLYPVYYGAHLQPSESQTGSHIEENVNSNTIIVGTPIGKSIAEPSDMGALRSIFSSTGVDVSCKKVGNVDVRDIREKSTGTQCDLSLRLGLFSDPSVRPGKISICETEDLGPSSSQEGAKYSDVFQQKNKELCFFPAKTANDPIGSSSRKLLLEGQNLGATMRKRKAPSGDSLDDGQFFTQFEPPSNQYNSRISRPDEK
ncbi:hypothetical protein SLEP1_g13349 [Rubroshorea leprosula]|uniref:Histone acetyltransferase n=1 Tax=Rubroshorea leprosula TaxID=152421 RepID=A0AAV5IPH1_9ROSI|nr:hypothetical protein SLEP1_g13349 [Rubroshorea leprosula]